MNDDDLPVLTQVLRTGGGRREIPPPRAETPEAFDVRPVEDTLGADRLTIGNDPDPGAAGDPGAAPAASGSEVVGPTTLTDRSAASDLLPDDDATASRPRDETFGEPELQHLPDDGFYVAPFAASTRDEPGRAFDAESLTTRVRDAVLEDLQTRIDTEFDARIAQAIHRELETALAQLQVDLRSHLTDALRDVVQRAVDEEVARLDPHRIADPGP